MNPGAYLDAMAEARRGDLEPEEKADRLARLLDLDDDGRRVLREALDFDPRDYFFFEDGS